jgi:hypothetical protein
VNRTAQSLLLDDGTVASTPLEMRQAWQTYFAHIKAAKIRPFAGSARQRARRQQESSLPVLIIDNVPAITELEVVFARTKKGKAAGEWKVPRDLLRLFPTQMARIWHPLLAKAALRIAEPIQMKGGTLIELNKRKRQMSQRENSRGILLSDDIA